MVSRSAFAHAGSCYIGNINRKNYAHVRNIPVMQQATAAPPGTAVYYQWRCHHPVANHPEYGGGIRRLSHGLDLYPLHTRWKLQQQMAVALPRATLVPPGHGTEADAALCGLARVWRACVSWGEPCPPTVRLRVARRAVHVTRTCENSRKTYLYTHQRPHLPPRSTVFPHRSRVARLHWRRASPTPTPYRHPLARGVSAAASGCSPLPEPLPASSPQSSAAIVTEGRENIMISI